MSRGLRRAWLIVILLSGAWVAACRTGRATSVTPHTPTPRPIVSVTAPTTPHSIVARPGSSATRPPFAPTTSAPAVRNYLLQGVVYDAAVDADVRLIDARLAWHFDARDLQPFDGERPVDENGAYQLPLNMRPEDEVAITASAPGYQPSTVRLRGDELGADSARLNFGLYQLARSAPTMPGDLGIVEVRGIVYNAQRGVKAVIAGATISIAHLSVIRPTHQLETTTGLTGTFMIPMVLHVSDQLNLTIAARGFITATLSRYASDLVKEPQLSIALKPVQP
jgi:hypothetical protein